MFIAMNRFQVNQGQEDAFEEMWRSRETYLQEVPGAATTEFVSHSTWASRADFDAWTQSEAFSRGHAQGSVQGILAGPPAVSLYETVLHEEKSAAGR